MVTVWRRAFCMSIRRDPETTSSATILEQQQQQQSASPSSSSSSNRSCVKLGMGIFSGSGGGGSNPSSNQSTPRLCSTTSTPRCQATSPPTTTPPKPLESTRLQCKTTAASNAAASSSRTTPRTSSSSTSANSKESPRLFRSSSPRSPSRFALFKTALRLSRNRCGICGESVRSNVGAVFTAECSHAFHFPCISSHVRSQGCLVCPVCSITWHDAPLLASSLHPLPPPSPSSANASASAGRPRSSHSSNRNRREGKKAFPTAASINSKIYDDDESLQLSPTSRVADGLLQFNPIPEEAEDSDKDAVAAAADDDDNDEYQHKEDVKQEGELQRVPALSVVPDCLALVSTSRNHLTYAVSIKVKAPPLPQQPQDAAAAAQTLPVIIPQSLSHNPSSRAPIDLVTVLDVSGNMTATKLQMLKRAMRLVISSLGPGDRLSIVAFSVAAAKRLFRLRRMSRTGQRSARQIVDRLVICGTTQAQAQTLTQGDFSSSSSCMGDALRKATKILEDRRERNPVATIMLLSDVQCQGGHDQQKEQNLYATTPRSSRSRSNQASSATRFTHIEIPIHASASFHKQQQQKRMPSPPDNGIIRVMEEENVFAKCMNGLVSVVLLDVHLQFSLPSASGVISSVYSYSYGGGGECDGGIGQAFSHGEGGKSVSLGDMYAVEERQLLVELKVPKTALIEGHAMLNMSIMCSYRDPLTRDVIHKPHVLPIPMPLQYQDQNHRQMNNQFPVLLRSYSSTSSTTMTVQSNQVEQQQLKNLFVTTRAVAESRHLVELSDFDTAIHLLSSARSLLLQQSTTAVGSNTQKKLVIRLEAELQGLQRVQLEQQQQQRLQQQHPHSLSPSHRRWSEQALLGEARGNGGGGEPLTPTSAWRAAEQLAKVAITRKSLNQVSDLHGLENARF